MAGQTTPPIRVTMSEQLTFALPFEPGLRDEDYLVGRFNADAYQTIGRWPDWPDRIRLLCGPKASGKSHLAHIWALKSGAAIIAMSSVDEANAAALVGRGALAIEHEDGSGDVHADETRRKPTIDERGLFHLLNLARERECFVLITTRTRPNLWAIETPDLLSRLRLAPVVEIDHPESLAFRALLAKLLHDRQLKVEPSVIEFLTLRCERSFAAAMAIVERLDLESLVQGRRITRAIASDALGQLAPHTLLDIE